MSFGFGESLLLIFIFIPILVIIFGYLWAKKKSNESSEEIPLTWFYYYTYVTLPIRLLIVLVNTVLSMSSGNTTAVMTQILQFILIMAVLIGLHKRTSWGWSLNIAYLALAIAPGVYSAESKDTALLSILGYGILYFLPNYIYFKKRIHLFSKTNIKS